MLYLWPRYFFIPVAGKGVSGFTFFALFLLPVAMMALLSSTERLKSFASSIAQSKAVLGLFVLWWAWRLGCDYVGVSPERSFGITILDFGYLGVWTITGAILFADRKLRSALPYIILFSGIIATIFGLIELSTGSTLTNTLGFSSFAVGDEYMLRDINSTLMRGTMVRIRSLYSHPLVYGQILASMSPVAIHFLLQSKKLSKLLGVILGACIVVSISICNARSPYFVAFSGSAVYFALYFLDPKSGTKMFILLWAVLTFLVVAPVATGAFFQVASGRTSEEAMSSSARDRQMEQGTRALMSRSITGYGDGNAASIASTRGIQSAPSVDNYYLSTAVDSGYSGAIILIVFLFAATLKGARLSYREPDPTARSIHAVCVGMVVALAAGLVILSITDTLSIIFLATGYFVAASSRRVGSRTITRGRRNLDAISVPFARG